MTVGAEQGPETSSPYPASWTVARALDAYLAENGFTKEEYDARFVWISFWRVTFPFPNPPSRHDAVRVHDLHHVATGYGTDPTGEAEISMWELARGLTGLSFFIKCIVVGGGLFGFLHSPRRTRAAFRSAKRVGGTLFPMSRREYEALLSMKVGDLRERLDLPRDGIASHPRGLHSAAPSVA